MVCIGVQLARFKLNLISVLTSKMAAPALGTLRHWNCPIFRVIHSRFVARL